MSVARPKRSLPIWKYSLGALLLATLSWALVSFADPPAVNAEELQDGDIIFQQSQSRQSEAIRQATDSPWTHVGVLWREGGRWVVYEASGKAVCITPLEHFTSRGVQQKVIIKRVKDSDRLLGAGGRERLKRSLDSYLGRPYDVRFDWDEKNIYCSELVWKAYAKALNAEVSRLGKVAELNHERAAVQAIIRERRALLKGSSGYDKLMDEPIVTPADLLNSQRLVEVYPKSS